MSKKKLILKENMVERAPVVVVMGHIDHGKSTLLDYIRKENTVAKESGGITQHVSAYEAEHNNKKITFIDTPGHEAFAAARSRGANIADIAILVVAADDGVSEQTLGALEFIKKSKIPFIVAINKIDLPNADIQKTKNSLIENEVYLEGMGGDISFIEISAKKGTNVTELLDTILLTAEIAELKTDLSQPASGFILESMVDEKKGVSAFLILKNGKINTGEVVVSNYSFSPVRILENFSGEKIKEAIASQPVKVIGFNSCPKAGDSFSTFKNKKDALKYIEELKNLDYSDNKVVSLKKKVSNKHIFPLIIKADVVGSVDAIKHQIKKIENDRSEFKIVIAETGKVSEKDIKALTQFNQATIVGFNTQIDRNISILAKNFEIELKIFNIIYELTDFLEKRLKSITPKEKFEEISGEAKILKVFSWGNKGGVIGGEVISGKISKNDKIKIIRRGEFIGKTTIKELQVGKKTADEVTEETLFGLNITSKYEIVAGDILQAVTIIEK